MTRPVQPREIAPAFVYLASGKTSSYVSGEILAVTGDLITA
jgi:NAD(P)-dependent dehydrogenase (short-subunit alcohol dehydrogenase family)